MHNQEHNISKKNWKLNTKQMKIPGAHLVINVIVSKNVATSTNIMNWNSDL